MPPTVIQRHSPAAEAWDWQLRGSCRGLESAVFFHPDGERGRARAARVRRAKEICGGCPVLAQCRSYALSVSEPYGVWGGMSEDERRSVVQRRAWQSAVG
ncbi:WhiB family transcriptional regulator [Nocardia donostiensis]|uniref:Transcriptional regulator WhiB n=1 Tax=Nocardia donostiensis TaxID=1538463 RepID=A0A1W0B4Q7_9NOCA|nr:WhiB family transcriptional regulator [Nocardia donostiensis]ONM46519.1 WhiB family transcriptional regulator [Nocardia donostiensis]OQS16696.1 WhiB family transcriptional regulator [Nocardia donostiensis]OQS17523.1 WhiB family transcriptional regulator [Nocardia donostiensis]